MRRCEGTETEKEVRTDMNKGRIVQVMGPVVDVLFEDGELPNIKDALEVDNGDKTCIMEVAQHLGNSEVRCLMLAASEGLHKDMKSVQLEAVSKFQLEIRHLDVCSMCLVRPSMMEKK